MTTHLALFARLKRWWYGAEAAPVPVAASPVVATPDAAAQVEVTEDITDDVMDADAEDLVIAESVISFDSEELALIDELAPQLLERSLAELPPPSAFPDRAARALSRRSFEFDELVKLGHTDVAIAAALLRIANSTLYAGGMSVDEIRDAVGRLGTTLSTSVVTGVAAQSLFDVETRAEHGVFADAFRDLFRQSMTVALVATRLSDKLRMGRASVAFSGGLFHDIGKVVALRALARLVLAGKAPPTMSQNVVIRLVEDIHVEIGIAMMKKWGLPNKLVELCAHHHAPDGAAVPDRALLHLVRVVSGLNAIRIDRVRNGSVVPEVQESATVLGLELPQLSHIFGDLRRTADQLHAMF